MRTRLVRSILEAVPKKKNMSTVAPVYFADIDNIELVRQFERAIELAIKGDGNGQTPFDKEALRNELLSRLASAKKEQGQDKGESL